jgi:hypothetical protein
MPADPRPQAVGRAAALRRLLAEIKGGHADEIAAWAIAAPEPAERGSIYQAGIRPTPARPAAGEVRASTARAAAADSAAGNGAGTERAATAGRGPRDAPLVLTRSAPR